MVGDAPLRPADQRDPAVDVEVNDRSLEGVSAGCRLLSFSWRRFAVVRSSFHTIRAGHGAGVALQLFATEDLGVSLDEIASRAGVGPGTVHRHFPTKEALYLAVATDQLLRLVAHAEALATTDDPAALFTQLSRMMAMGAENVAVKSALAAAEFDLRTAAPRVAADLTRHVADLLNRASSRRRTP